MELERTIAPPGHHAGFFMELAIPLDPYFRVLLCPYGTSADIQKAIWSAQHQCVIEGFTADDVPPPTDKAGHAVIRHQLNVEHFSVLKFAFVKLDCAGFPRSMFEQIVRHKDSEFLQFPSEQWSPDWLVQSNRYTGDRFVQVALGLAPIEEVLYLRAPGLFKDRMGNLFEYTYDERERDKSLFKLLCENYASKRERGCPYEMARGILSSDIRVNFTMAGNLEAMWHWLDQRTKKDSQIEIRIFAELAQAAIFPTCPELSYWYSEHRAGKARLAP